MKLSAYNYRFLFSISSLLFSVFTYGQNPVIPNLPVFPTSTTSQIPNYTIQPGTTSNIKSQNPASIYPFPGQNIQQRQNQNIMQEVEQQEKLRENAMNEAKADIQELISEINYDLPSHSNIEGTKAYVHVYEKMLTLNVESYSLKDVNFDIENAYFENRLDKAEFDKTIKQSADFILAKMKERNFDMNSNTAKNFMLFEFFTEPMQVKGFKEKHFPIKYDFEDYWGRENWAKMFVTKLLKTNTGQCHSMPLLYLILAEAINAQAFLALSPNHSYIKFQDEKGKWYNLELTNGMLTVSSFILNNGFITAEAMQNKIYMQNLTKQQMLSQFYTDLASGYLHKFGYDEFVDKAISKALELYPTNINANMVKANYNEARLKYVVKKLGIDTQTQEGRNKILNYPKAIEILQQMHAQYKIVDDLGFQFMPGDAYEKWLGSLKETKNKEESAKLAKQFKGTMIKIKN